jgi:predicted TIM-barrel fold metal-dependent hydrolase
VIGCRGVIAALIGAGVLERHPRLKVSFGESGIGWLPYALDRMDFEYEDRFRDLIKMKPSEYWRRQCKATFQFDPIGTKLVDDIGVETLMWGSDYPHTDGVWPESSKYIDTGRYRTIAAIFRSAIRINWENIPVSPNGTVVLRCIQMIQCRA